MLNMTRRHLADLAAARRAERATRLQLSRLTLAPGMAVRVDRHYDRRMGHLVTITAWWDHPVTGERAAVQDTVPAMSGTLAAAKAVARVVNMLHARLRADRMDADA